MTGIFVCSKCNHVDHMDIRYNMGNDIDVDGRPVPLFCTVCVGLPWHNRMVREQYNPELHGVVNPPDIQTQPPV